MSQFMQSLVNRCMSMWPRSVGASLSRVVARGLGDTDARCRGCVIDVLVYAVLD